MTRHAVCLIAALWLACTPTGQTPAESAPSNPNSTPGDPSPRQGSGAGPRDVQPDDPDTPSASQSAPAVRSSDPAQSHPAVWSISVRSSTPDRGCALTRAECVPRDASAGGSVDPSVQGAWGGCAPNRAVPCTCPPGAACISPSLCKAALRVDVSQAQSAQRSPACCYELPTDCDAGLDPSGQPAPL